jgi:DMSO reductase family type II enzyme chaperone
MSTENESSSQIAAARSRAYQLFQQALTYPEAELCDWIRSGALAEELRACFGAIDPGLCAADAEWSDLRDAGDVDALAVEYTRLFDAGASGPPCPLYGGLYGGARMKTMEEAVRFYNHFGLTLSEEQRELPDHLATQLEFLHYLSFREAEALEGGTDAGAYQRAQRDFVERHPGSWIPELIRRLAEQDAHPFFRALVARLADLLARDQQNAPAAS